MFGILFRFKAKPEKFQELVDFFKENGEVCRDQEPGTLRFEFYPDRIDSDPKDADPKDEYTLYVYEAYRDRSAFEEHKENEPSSVVTSKAAIRGHLKTGQWSVAGTSRFLRL